MIKRLKYVDGKLNLLNFDETIYLLSINEINIYKCMLLKIQEIMENTHGMYLSSISHSCVFITFWNVSSSHYRCVFNNFMNLFTNIA